MMASILSNTNSTGKSSCDIRHQKTRNFLWMEVVQFSVLLDFRTFKPRHRVRNVVTW
jgi:hypothetical protein